MCLNCIDKARKMNHYKGKVNMDIRPVFFGQAIIKFQCFTCGMVETTKLGVTPQDLKDFEKQIKKIDRVGES